MVSVRDGVIDNMVHLSETTPPFRIEYSGAWVLETCKVHTDINFLENGILAKALTTSNKATRPHHNSG